MKPEDKIGPVGNSDWFDLGINGSNGSWWDSYAEFKRNLRPEAIATCPTCPSDSNFDSNRKSEHLFEYDESLGLAFLSTGQKADVFADAMGYYGGPMWRDGSKAGGVIIGAYASGKLGTANVEVRGFGGDATASNDNRKGTGYNVLAYGLDGDANIHLDTKLVDARLSGKASVFRAESQGFLGMYKNGSTTNYGVGLEGGLYGVKFEGTLVIRVFGLYFGFTDGSSMGSAHIGGRASYSENTNGKWKLGVEGHLGLIIGKKYKFTISNAGKW